MKKRQPAKGLIWMVCVLAGSILLAYMFHTPLLRAAGGSLVENDGPHRADAALVLGGDEPCTRILTAAKLARDGYVPVVYVSGPVVFDAHESDFTIACAVHRGFSASLFRPVPNACTSTRCEANLFSKLLRRDGVHSLLLVTSNYHTRRAARLMRQANPGVRVFAIAAPDPGFTVDDWWRRRDDQKTFLLEWMKTVNTWLGN